MNPGNHTGSAILPNLNTISVRACLRQKKLFVLVFYSNYSEVPRIVSLKTWEFLINIFDSCMLSQGTTIPIFRLLWRFLASQLPSKQHVPLSAATCCFFIVVVRTWSSRPLLWLHVTPICHLLRRRLRSSKRTVFRPCGLFGVVRNLFSRKILFRHFPWDKLARNELH